MRSAFSKLQSIIKARTGIDYLGDVRYSPKKGFTFKTPYLEADDGDSWIVKQGDAQVYITAISFAAVASDCGFRKDGDRYIYDKREGAEGSEFQETTE